MSVPRPSELRCFHENSPRPPVPGEEREGYSQSQLQRCQSSSPSSVSTAALDPQVKDPQPRRIAALTCDATSAPLGFEPEGRACDRSIVMEDVERRSSCSGKGGNVQQTTGGSNDEVSESSPLAHRVLHKWTQNLHALLEDPKGLELFEHYLQQEGHINELPFYFACEGLKEERDPNKLTAIIKVLIRRFLQRQQIALPDKMRKEMTRRYREGQADKCMFKDAQNIVGRLIEETTYPNFLRSDVYLQYVEHCQRVDSNAPVTDVIAGTTSKTRHAGDNDREAGVESLSSPDEPSMSCSSNLLPTLLEEDNDLIAQQQLLQQKQLHHHVHQHQQHQHSSSHHSHHQHHHPTSKAAATNEFSKGEMRLTKDVLMATQQIRALEVRPKPEAYAGIYLQPGASPYHSSVSRPRAQYSSYNPVSRQDSELQSLSSDARTESDNLSLTDASLSDNASIVKRNTRKQYIRHMQTVKKSAMINRDPAGHETIIPRTQLVKREQTQPLPPEAFARQLIEKLERVRKDRENEEKLNRKLKEVDLSSHCDSLSEASSSANLSMPCNFVFQSGPHQPQEPHIFSDPLCQNDLEEDSETQAILDQHVQRVWNDQTPLRSPKVSSPRPRSPDKCRRQQQQQHQQQQQQQQQMQNLALSAQQYSSRPPSYRSQRKEKDVFSTFSGDSGNVHDFPEAGELHGAGSMSSLGSHLPKSKSVPSDYADSLHTQDLYIPGQNQHYRRLDAQRSSATKKSMTELTDSGVSVVSDATSAAAKGSRAMNWYKDGSGTSGPVSAKTELNVNLAKLSRKKYPDQPAQPFIGVTGMPLLPQPHTDTQLEEAKRRLEFEQNRNRPERQRYTSSAELMSPNQPSCVQPSNQSTLRRGKQEAVSEFTTVVFSFCEEKVPYRTKISGYGVTLKQFKDVLPKKGNYRYFFRTACEDLDMQVIQEEVTEDLEVLPLWEGKIMATVKALE